MATLTAEQDISTRPSKNLHLQKVIQHCILILRQQEKEKVGSEGMLQIE